LLILISFYQSGPAILQMHCPVCSISNLS